MALEKAKDIAEKLEEEKKKPKFIIPPPPSQPPWYIQLRSDLTRLLYHEKKILPIKEVKRLLYIKYPHLTTSQLRQFAQSQPNIHVNIQTKKSGKTKTTLSLKKM